MVDFKKLDSWHKKSSVRSKKEVEFYSLNNIKDGKYFFTPKLAPIVEHPLIYDYGEETKRKILIYFACLHSNFTDTLEAQVVVPLCNSLSREELGFKVTPTIKDSARKIAVDEMYHSMFISTMEEQICEYTKCKPIAKKKPRYLTMFHEMLANKPKSSQNLLHTFFVIVSETLITSTLREVPSDKTVHYLVRQNIQNHFEDEAMHHLFFSQLLMYLWDILSNKEKKYIGLNLPYLLEIYFTPDRPSIIESLLLSGIKKEDAISAYNETYTKKSHLSDILEGSKTTLRHFKKAGVFSDPEIEDAFFEKGLIN